MSYLCVGAVPVQWDWLNSALSPVVYGDIALSINTYKKMCKLHQGIIIYVHPTRLSYVYETNCCCHHSMFNGYT